jgi:hypothetical protein
MRDRLTKRTENGGVQFSNGEYWNTVYPQNENCLTDIHQMAIKLCELEDKIEQGKILELPCKVGQMVYVLGQTGHTPTVLKGTVDQFIFNKNSPHIDIGFDNSFAWDYRAEDFGKTVFFTREEAEKALERREG